MGGLEAVEIREKYMPELKTYKESDVYGINAKELEDMFLGSTTPEAQIQLTDFAIILADKIKEAEVNRFESDRPTAVEIMAYFNRERTVQTVNDIIEIDYVRTKEIKAWVAYAMDQINKDVKGSLDDVVEDIKEGQKEVSAYGYCIKERFELADSIYKKRERWLISAIGELASMSDQDYYSTRVGKILRKDQLKEIFKKSFGITFMPKGISRFVCIPHINEDNIDPMIGHLKEALGKESSMIVGELEAYFKSRHENIGPELQVNMYSATNTLIDRGCGVDAFIEVTDLDGNVVDRVFFDLTSDPRKVQKKFRRMNSGFGLANAVVKVEKEDLLPLEGDMAEESPANIRALNSMSTMNMLDMLRLRNS